MARKNLRDASNFWLTLAALPGGATAIAITTATTEYHPPWTTAWFIAGLAAFALTCGLAAWALALYLAHNHADQHACPDAAAHVAKSGQPTGPIQAPPAEPASSPSLRLPPAAVQVPPESAAPIPGAEVSRETVGQATEPPAVTVQAPTLPERAQVLAIQRGPARFQLMKTLRQVSNEERAELRMVVAILAAFRTEGQPEDVLDFSQGQREALEDALRLASPRVRGVLLNAGKQTPAYRRALIEYAKQTAKSPEPQPAALASEA